jgi:hypothetical protein
MRIALVFLLLCGVAAAQESFIRDVTINTNGTAVATFEEVRGILDSIYVSGPTNANVAIAYAPRGGHPAVTIATNVTTQAFVFRPVKQSTGAAGAVVSEDYSKYVMAGENVTVTLSGSTSNTVWRVVLKKE